jgi:aspartate racemase
MLAPMTTAPAGTAPPGKPIRVGIVGGLGELAGADVLGKFVGAAVAAGRQAAVVFEQQPRPEVARTTADGVRARKFYVFEQLKAFGARRLDLALVPCFISHTFLDELRPELELPVIDLIDAVVTHLARRLPRGGAVGLLASEPVRADGRLARRLVEAGLRVVHPSDMAQASFLAAIYGPEGIRAGGRPAGDPFGEAFDDLVARGAQAILPAITEAPVALRTSVWAGVPVVDVNQVYAQYALDCAAGELRRPFKIGIVGGVGPAATVDFMDKILKHTAARRDQDHVRMVVEHNPQIPDRTGHLIGGGADPTIALYAACKRLEADDADLIAIPCNTAHAFVARVQPHLGIPIVNMLDETARHLAQMRPGHLRIGLLATTGTVATRVYHDALEAVGLAVVVPDAAHQELVMQAIYGEDGIKAGRTDGACAERVRRVLRHLVALGAGAVVLGCTELPLVFAGGGAVQLDVDGVPVIDPTAVLARACVRHAGGVPAQAADAGSTKA